MKLIFHSMSQELCMYFTSYTFFKTEAYSESCQTSRVEVFAKVVRKPPTNPQISFIVDVRLGSKYISE